MATEQSQTFDSQEPDGQVSQETTSESTKATEQQEDVDYKSLYEQEAASRAKLENDYNSLRTGKERQAERDQRFLGTIEEQIQGLAKSQATLVNALASDNIASAVPEIENINRETQQTVQASRFDRAADALWDELNKATVRNSETVIDLQGDTSPEVAAIRSRWNAAHENRQVGDLQLIVSDLNRLTETRRYEQAQQTVSALQEQVKNARQEVLEETDALNLDVGAQTREGGSVNDEAFIRKIADPTYMPTPEDWARYNKYKREQGMR